MLTCCLKLIGSKALLSLYNVYILFSCCAICCVGAIVCQVCLSSLWPLEWDLDWISMGLLNSRFHFMIYDLDKDNVLFRFLVCYSTFRTNESTAILNHQGWWKYVLQLWSGKMQWRRCTSILDWNCGMDYGMVSGMDYGIKSNTLAQLCSYFAYYFYSLSSLPCHLCLVLACFHTASSKLQGPNITCIFNMLQQKHIQLATSLTCSKGDFSEV